MLVRNRAVLNFICTQDLSSFPTHVVEISVYYICGFFTLEVFKLLVLGHRSLVKNITQRVVINILIPCIL